MGERGTTIFSNRPEGNETPLGEGEIVRHSYGSDKRDRRHASGRGSSEDKDLAARQEYLDRLRESTEANKSETEALEKDLASFGIENFEMDGKTKDQLKEIQKGIYKQLENAKFTSDQMREIMSSPNRLEKIKQFAPKSNVVIGKEKVTAVPEKAKLAKVERRISPDSEAQSWGIPKDEIKGLSDSEKRAFINSYKLMVADKAKKEFGFTDKEIAEVENSPIHWKKLVEFRRDFDTGLKAMKEKARQEGKDVIEVKQSDGSILRMRVKLKAKEASQIKPEVPTDKNAKSVADSKPGKSIDGVRPVPPDVELTRKAAQVTISRADKFADLNAPTEKQGEEKFKEKTRQLWKEFAVSGMLVRDSKNPSSRVVRARTDLDGRSSMGLFELAGMNTDDTKFLSPGDSEEGRINVDTGNKNGLEIENKGDTAYFDHHGPESGKDSSSAKYVYETLTKLGLLEKQPHLDQLMDFVTQVDNRFYPGEDKLYKDSWHTVLGLSRFIPFHKLEMYFKAGRMPNEILSEQDLKNLGLEKQSQDQKSIIERSEKRIKELGEQGYIVDSKKYGKVVVDIEKTIPGGFEAVKADGAGVYIIWSPDNQSFFLSSNGKPLDINLPQGKKIRETMWLKENQDKGPLRIKLSDILKAVTENDLTVQGALKEYLDKENSVESKTDHKEVAVEEGSRDQLLAQVRREMQDDMGKVNDRLLEGMSDHELKILLHEYSRSKTVKEKEYSEMTRDELLERARKEISDDMGQVDEKLLAEMDDHDLRVLLHEYSRSGKKEVSPVPGEVLPEREPVISEETNTLEIRGRVVDISALKEQYARLEAEEMTREKISNSSFMTRWFWRMGEAGLLRNNYENALADIDKNKSLSALIERRMLGRPTTGISAESVNERILDRVLLDYEKEIVDSAEKGELVVDTDINLSLADIFYRFTKGEFKNRAEFEKEIHAHVMPKLAGKEFGKGDSTKSKGDLYAMNFWHMAEAYKGKLENLIEGYEKQYGPENKEGVVAYLNGLMKIDIELGRKQRDLNNTAPEGKLGFAERTAEALQGLTYKIPGLNRLTPLITANPVFYGATASVMGQMAARKIVRAGLVGSTAFFVGGTIAPLLAGAALGGALMWARRGRDIKRDRGLDLRRQALGDETTGTNTDKVREYAYEFKTAKELTQDLKNLKGKTILADADLELIANISARLEVEKSKKVDLIRVSEDTGQYGVRMFELSELKEELKDLETQAGGKANPELAQLIANRMKELEADVEEKDKAFDKFSRNEKIKAGVYGALAGVAAGVVSQEVFHHISGHHAAGEDYSIIDKIRGYEHVSNGPMHVEQLPGVAGMVKLPEGQHLEMSGNAYNIVGSDGKIVERGIQFGQDGALTKDTSDMLRSHGFGINEAKEIVIEKIPGTTISHIASMEELKDNPIFQGLRDVGRRDWHDEAGERFSKFFNKAIEFEGKQQMLYLDRQPDGIVSLNIAAVADNLVKNAHKAFEEYGTNPDGSVDSKLAELRDNIDAWAKSGELAKHLKAVVIPTSEGYQNASGLVFEGNGNSIDLSKGVSDLFNSADSLKNGHLPVKFLELRLDDHVLATAIGNNLEIPGATEMIEQQIHVPVIELRPPVPPEYVVPLPFARRKGLEGPGREKNKKEKPVKTVKEVNPERIEDKQPKSERGRRILGDIDPVLKTPEAQNLMGFELSPPPVDTTEVQMDLPLAFGSGVETVKFTPGGTKEVKQLTEGKFEAPTFRDVLKVIKEINGIDKKDKEKISKVEDRLVEVRNGLFDNSKDRKYAKRAFESFMLALGFRRKDWAYKKGHIEIRSIKQVKEVTNWFLNVEANVLKDRIQGILSAGINGEGKIHERQLKGLIGNEQKLLAKGNPVPLLTSEGAWKVLKHVKATFEYGNKREKPDYTRIEEIFTDNLNKLIEVTGDKQKAINLFTEVMTILGFERGGTDSDWSLSKEGRIKIKHVGKSKELFEWHKNHRKQFDEWVDEVSENQDLLNLGPEIADLGKKEAIPLGSSSKSWKR